MPGVSRTAIGVAALRDRESRRPDRLFDDPYAGAFVDAARALIPDLPVPDAHRPLTGVGALFYTPAVLRTRFYDGYLLDAAAAGCTQVVLLAAGLDTRAFRLAWPSSVRLYELDLPEVLEFKQRVLDGRSATPSCERAVVHADLREDWTRALVTAGFRPSAPTVWLIEGLLVYLSRPDAEGLLEAVHGLSAPGSQVSFEHTPPGDDGLIAQARAAMPDARVTALWKDGLGGDGPGWLAERGWRCAVHTRAELAREYGRPLEETDSGGGFLTAVRG
jgi:methyltransferase (TIGR00027 family)